jgi:Ca2+-binding EF-hand superfamily protein
MTSINSLGSLADALKQMQEAFTKTDTDKSGKLSKAEFTAALGDVNTGNGATAASIFAQTDTDGDGQLTQAELTDGAALADKVKEALLMAQELMSGATLMNMIGSKPTTSPAASMFGDDTEKTGSLEAFMGTDDTAASDPYTSMIEQVIAKYKAAETEAAEAAKAPITIQA